MYEKDEPHIRIMNVDKLVPESNFFFHDTFIETIFQSYGPANLDHTNSWLIKEEV